MVYRAVTGLFLLLSIPAVAWEERILASPKTLYELADVVAVVQLVAGQVDGSRPLLTYSLTGSVVTMLKGGPIERLSFKDTALASRCPARMLGSFYLVFLGKGGAPLDVQVSIIEVEEGPKRSPTDSRSLEELRQQLTAAFGKKPYIGPDQVWFLKECAGEERYNELMASILEYAFNRHHKTLPKARRNQGAL